MNEQDKPRYHGFTCPTCGSHHFGTFRWHSCMGDKYPHGTRVGSCHENQHMGNGCTFEWNRDDSVAEDTCMYEKTREEWAASFKESVSTTAPSIQQGEQNDAH